MDKFERIASVSEHDRFYGKENLHPLVSVTDFSEKFPRVYASKMIFGFYAVYLKDVQCGDIKYGRDTYDYQDRTLVFVGNPMDDYTFFSYESREALHLCNKSPDAFTRLEWSKLLTGAGFTEKYVN